MANEYAFEEIMKQMLDGVDDNVDKRQGSIIYDALAPIALSISKSFSYLEAMEDTVYLDTAKGTYLQRAAIPTNLVPLPATQCIREIQYEGTTPTKGMKFFVEDVFWIYIGDGKVECETAGEEGNRFIPGVPLTPVEAVSGIDNIILGKVIIPGTEMENDEQYRSRIFEYLRKPKANTNVAQVQAWCKDVKGVGGVRVFPTKHGKNTVEVVIIDTDKMPASPDILKAIQDKIDPSDEFGEHGLGLGEADIGVVLTTVAAKPVEVNIDVEVELEQGAELELTKTKVEEELVKYTKSIAFKESSHRGIKDVFKYAEFGSIIFGLDEVSDYHNLLINGKDQNLIIPLDCVAIKGEVTLNVKSQLS